MVRTLINVPIAKKIDLVVIGSNGVGGIREFFIGSNAEKIVRNSPIPVLVVKDFPKGSGSIKNIVFPNTLETEDQEDLYDESESAASFL